MQKDSPQVTQTFTMKDGRKFQIKFLIESAHQIPLCKTMVYVPAYKKIMAKYFCIRNGSIALSVETANSDQFCEPGNKRKRQIVEYYPRTDFYTTKKDAEMAARRGRWIGSIIPFYFHEEPNIFSIEKFFVQPPTP